MREAVGVRRMATFRLQEAVRLPHVATYRLQETVGAEIVILVTITDEPPRARRLLCNGYKHASMRSEDELSNVRNQGDRSLIQAWIKDLSP